MTFRNFMKKFCDENEYSVYITEESKYGHRKTTYNVFAENINDAFEDTLVTILTENDIDSDNVDIEPSFDEGEPHDGFTLYDKETNTKYSVSIYKED